MVVTLYSKVLQKQHGAIMNIKKCVIDMPVHKYFVVLFLSVKQLRIKFDLICINLP